MRKITFGLLLIFTFMIPWESGAVVGSFGTLTKLLGIVLFGLWIGIVIASGKLRRLRPFHLVLFLFVLWNVASLFWTVNINASLNRIETYVQLILLSMIVLDLIDTKSKLQALLQVYIFGACISVWSILSNYFSGNVDGAHAERYTSFGFNANEIAMLLVPCIPIAWYLIISISEKEQINNADRVLLIINYVFIPFAFFAILLTASRTAFIALIPGWWFILGSLTKFSSLSRIFIAIAITLSIIFLQPLVPQASIDRLSTTEEELTEGDLSGRKAIWEQGTDAFLENPILGVGSGGFRYAIEKGRASHNSYLSVLVDGGLTGFLLFGLVVGAACYQLRGQPKWIVSFWVVVLIGWGIGLYSINAEHRKTTWLLLTLVVVSAHVYKSTPVVSKKLSKRNDNKANLVGEVTKA